MPRGGSKPGQRRGGRKPGTPNKLPKGERALVKLDAAEHEIFSLKAQGLPIDTLGKDRMTELDTWAHAMALQFAPKKDDKGKLYWDNDGDEARFLRFFKLSGELAAARAPYESPRLSAIAAADLRDKAVDVSDDPHANLIRIVQGWIDADEAERAERAKDVTPGADADQRPLGDDLGVQGERRTVGLIPATGATDDEGIDGEMA